MSTPMWAERLVEDVCGAAGLDQPEVQWRRSRDNSSSSGRYFYIGRRLVITAGSDRRDQRLVLLHELAHHLTPNDHHGTAFWTAAWRLFERFGLARYALTRESHKALSLVVAQSIGVRGSKTAAAKASTRRRATAQPRDVCPMPADLAASQGYRTPHTHYVGTIHRWTEPDGGHWTDFITGVTR